MSRFQVTIRVDIDDPNKVGEALTDVCDYVRRYGFNNASYFTSDTYTEMEKNGYQWKWNVLRMKEGRNLHFRRQTIRRAR